MSYLNLKDEDTLKVVVELNILLANYHVYYQKLRSNHWNILGENFFDLHAKFEDLYSDARIKIDEIAERILTLRYHPMSKLEEYLKVSSIEEGASTKSDSDMVEETLDDHKKLLKQMSKVIKSANEISDEGTVDLIGGYIRALEKSSWMLNAWSKETKDNLKEATVEMS
ncbi:DNA starvation/stationary phase protection protein [Tamlana sp. 2_MG-2023]|uniref:Dps family protein n=1 Tax=unclassified Tamlana TaxID=2614803 RepID=UPI0026E3C9ED|nr:MULTISPECIES: DNA starvation/stationary phase protection protein [unclassified Tamlana]MDO6759454.1 DNA starvation/stationary phase protection protein [Tamlana sp. 2_MG-2023]MDO6790407.1 DNA starvation/stationary phase protection protein [Tamlana sp. 1_MG-2023]